MDEDDIRRGYRRQWHPMGGAFYGYTWRMGLAQRGCLRPAVLRLLGEQPMNGIELMDKMQEMSMGWYRPSPGSVYPLLEQLEGEGLISMNREGNYALTKRYNEQFGPVGETEQALASMESTVSYLEELQKSDKAKFAAYKRRVEKIAERLSKL